MVGPGVDGPEEDSSLFSLSSGTCTRSVVRSSSNSNTGSVVCGVSSGCVEELRDTLSDRFPASEGVLEKSHESKVL